MIRNRLLLAISFVVFIAYVGTDMVVPVRVLYAEEQGASLAIIGAMATAFLLSNFLFQYPMGALADRWGRKRIMIIGLILQAAISFVYIFVSDPVMFVVLRLLEGVASATVLPPARALVADNTAPERRGEAYGVFNSFFNASLLLGPAIGSFLATFGYGFVFVGAVVARLIAVMVMVLLVSDPHSHAAAQSSRGAPFRLRDLFTLPLVGAYILVFGDYLYLGYDLTLFPLWMHDHLGATVGVIGLAYITWAIPNTILSPFGGRLADRVRRSTLILGFGAAQVPLYLTYGSLEVAWPVVVIGLLHGAIYAMMQPAVDSHLAASSREEIRARVQGAYSSVGLAAAFVGANGFSVLYTMNYHLPLFAMAGAFGLCVVMGGVIVRISEARGLVTGPHTEVLPAATT